MEQAGQHLHTGQPTAGALPSGSLGSALVFIGAAGFFFGLPNPVLHLPALALLYPFCLYLLSMTASTSRAALQWGWLLGFAGNVAGLYWMVYPMHDVAGMPFILAAPCVALLFAYFACYAALTALGIRRLHTLFPGTEQKEPGGTVSSALVRSLAPPLLAGLAWGGFEVICGLLFTGFPWLSLSTAFAFHPLWVQAASLVGGYGLSSLYAACAFLLAAALLAPPSPKRRLPVLSAIVLMSAIAGYGAWRLESPLPPADGAGLTVVMAQGNVDQNHKWDPAFQQGTLRQYLALSEEALAEAKSAYGPDRPILVLWPETAMPFYFQHSEDYALALRDFVLRNNVHLAFGTLGVDYAPPPPAKLHNRLYLFSSLGGIEGYYDKQHLVPFGEYMPFAADIPFLRDLLQGLDFSSGKEDAPLVLEEKNLSLPLGALICYESIFPALAQERVANGAQMLVNISNDGWFRKSSAPLQHLAHAVLRAVEQARPLLRSTNTGVTAVIDARGTITARIPGLFTADTLVASAVPGREITPFHRLQPALTIALAALALFSLLGYKLRRTPDKA